MNPIPKEHLVKIIQNALDEDLIDFTGKIPTGDHSALAIFEPGMTRTAQLIAKQDGIIAGVELAQLIFMFVDPTAEFSTFITDGSKVKKGDIVFKVRGSAQDLLTAERTALNFMQRMSGTATLTHQFVEKCEGTKAKILDTRKTNPGLRHIDKWAVKIGGGCNHRMGLYDMIMLKDNHNDFVGGIESAVARTVEYLKQNNFKIPIEVETRNIEEVKTALNIAAVDRIMLDNFTFDEVREAVEVINGAKEVEVSGMVNLETVAEYAKCGPDFISVGALTHSAGSLDMSLKAVNE